MNNIYLFLLLIYNNKFDTVVKTIVVYNHVNNDQYETVYVRKMIFQTYFSGFCVQGGDPTGTGMGKLIPESKYLTISVSLY